MDFEIEDDDDPYDFQSNWSKPTKDKSGGFGFGGKDDSGGDDAYNYDFGAIKEETSHYSGSDKSKSKKDTASSAAVIEKSKPKPKPVTGGNAMEKAAAMLDRYSGKSSTKPSVPVKTYNRNTSLDFDEDDISISMGSDDSYEDSYPSKKEITKKTFEPDSPLYGGLDSDIPHMKKKSHFGKTPSFQEQPTIKGLATFLSHAMLNFIYLHNSLFLYIGVTMLCS